MSKSDRAIIYLGTEGPTLTPQELDKLTALTAFARAQSWELLGALIEPFSFQPTKERKQLVADWRAGHVDGVIMWDDEHGYPGVWTDDLPYEFESPVPESPPREGTYVDATVSPPVVRDRGSNPAKPGE
ncbi:hypothetical protein [Streptomyces afghaniensis]|uniref:hypothetical protein n=1 Tax=Streptomyces afghaniensis TaxID=66865 RepID=UPI0027828B6A|nr:hypothetical protein [Streptomyces afghaniensis]MDQ1016706.1 hypothetical protein [Streptomyces afghaniensis]